MHDIGDRIVTAIPDETDDGLHHGLLHVIRDAGGVPEVVMFLRDAELRPLRLTFDPDGTVRLPAGPDGPRFRPDQLEVIAGKCPEAEDLWRKIHREDASTAR